MDIFLKRGDYINIPMQFNQRQIDYINKTKTNWLNIAEGG